VPTSQKPKPKGKKHTLKSKRGARRLKRLSTADVVGSKAIIDVYEQRRSSIESTDRLDIDSGLWGRARTQWMLGDWDSLASLELGHLEQAPHRAELAALSACAQLQKGDKQSARKSLAAASRWNCAPAFMVRALVAGSEASMARYHEICGRDEKSLQLLASSAGALGGDGRLAATARKALAAPPSQGQSDASRPSPEMTSHSVAADESPSLTLEEAIAAAKQEESPWAKPGITSYAQNLEDVMLWRALGHIENGFYIDIGAQHPVIDSVSKAFYERGWRGIHVEATLAYAELLRTARPDELVIQAALSDRHGVMTFYLVPQTGLSTGDELVANMLRGQGWNLLTTSVTSTTLLDIVSAAGDRIIHWMKIDVEGMEQRVLCNFYLLSNKPWILVIESMAPSSPISVHAEWEHEVIKAGYLFAYFDGLNRYYVHELFSDLLSRFSTPPNVFDNYLKPT
jgi:FkbM family methyltransferase